MMCNSQYEIEAIKMQLGIPSDSEIFASLDNKNKVDNNHNHRNYVVSSFSKSNFVVIGELEEALIGGAAA